jgi:proline dehydrogenase
MRAGFVKRSVARFMPGEQLEDAVRAASSLQADGITSILTHLGENIARIEEADEVFQHDLSVIDHVQHNGLDAHISVKPTQLGFDQDVDVCFRHLVSCSNATRRDLPLARHGELAAVDGTLR